MPNVGWEDFSKFGSSLYLCGHGSVSHHASSLGDIQQNSHQNRSAYVDELIESKFAVIGTPADAIRHIEHLEEKSGGFGSFLLTIGDWGGRDGQLRSTELIARKVIPHFNGQLAAPQQAWKTMKAGAAELKATIQNAQAKATERHAAEQAAKGR